MKEEKYFISVGEPWDFESIDGQNIVGGNIVAIKSNQCLVFKTKHYLRFDGVKGNILILIPRYYGNDFSNLSNGHVVINGSLLLKEYCEVLSEKELQENAQFVIVGSIKKG